MMSHGADGLKQAAEDAVLNANYVLARLKSVMTPAFDGTCMHEALFDDRFLKDTGVTTLDFAKAMIDEGYHPMTMYFPLVVHGAMLIEPTETERGPLLRHASSGRSRQGGGPLLPRPSAGPGPPASRSCGGRRPLRTRKRRNKTCVDMRALRHTALKSTFPAARM
jgi:hypothetical protein